MAKSKDDFLLQGRWKTSPKSSAFVGGGCPTIESPFEEKLVLLHKQPEDLYLVDDAVATVPFGDVTDAHLVLIKTDKKVTVRLTSAEGATQIVPVDSLLYLICETVPYTAIDVQREAGVETNVKVLLGEKV